MKTLLIDGGYVTHCAAAMSPDTAADTAVRMVRNFLKQLEGTRAIIGLDCPRDEIFRRVLFPGYKPKTTPRPPEVDAARAGMEAEYVCRCLPGLEADDVLGILATCGDVEGERIIVACDKDMLTVPGLHYNPRAASRSVVAVSERDADYNHMRQALTGDSGDGYPGCPGVGPEKVKRILWGEPRQWWGQVVTAFRGKGRTAADALLQARLARILRAEDFDFGSKRPVLWNPPVFEPAAAGGAA